MRDCHTDTMILAALRRELEADDRLVTGRMLGRQWRPLHPLAMAVHELVGPHNVNNILMHLARPDTSTGSFNVGRASERRLLRLTAEVLGLAFDPLTGYCTSGGTEANLYALWCAREWATARADRSRGVRWLVPVLAHYSVDKALGVLGVGNLPHHEVVPIGHDDDLRTDAAALLEAIGAARAENLDIVVALSLGTTEFGLLDPVAEVTSLLERDGSDDVFLHVDAALGGLSVPFLPAHQGVLSSPTISTIAVDYHKALGAPIGAAAVLVNRSLHRHTWTPAPYLFDIGGDFTLAGSRNGVTVIQTWAVLEAERDALAASANACHRRALELADRLRDLDGFEVLGDPDDHVVVFRSRWSREPGLSELEALLYGFGISPTVRPHPGGVRWYRVLVRDDTSAVVIGQLLDALGGFAQARREGA